MRPEKSRGFSLPEVILALGLLAVAILSLLAVSVSTLRSDSKALETAAGRLIADQVMKRLLDQMAEDPAVRESFLSGDFQLQPWDQGTLTHDNTVFSYTILARTVRDGAGDPVGKEAPGNRLKKVDIKVWWTDEANRTRQGYGRLQVETTQLISEAALATGEEE